MDERVGSALPVWVLTGPTGAGKTDWALRRRRGLRWRS